jgi:hypothetical protein
MARWWKLWNYAVLSYQSTEPPSVRTLREPKFTRSQASSLFVSVYRVCYVTIDIFIRMCAVYLKGKTAYNWLLMLVTWGKPRLTSPAMQLSNFCPLFIVDILRRRFGVSTLPSQVKLLCTAKCSVAVVSAGLNVSPCNAHAEQRNVTSLSCINSFGLVGLKGSKRLSI